MTLRVDHGELEETDPHGEGLWLMTWKGEFFTGVAFTLHGDGSLASEIPFVDGCAHGRCISVASGGQITREYEMEHGRSVGRDRAWWPDGTPRWDRFHGRHPDYREQRWNQAGVLVIDRDDVARKSRTWYDDGTLRHERLGDTARAFAPAGQLLFTQLRQPDGSDITRFEDDAMEASIEALLVDADWWYVALGYLRSLAERDRGPATLSRRNGRLLRCWGIRSMQRVPDIRPAFDAVAEPRTRGAVGSPRRRHARARSRSPRAACRRHLRGDRRIARRRRERLRVVGRARAQRALRCTRSMAARFLRGTRARAYRLTE